MKDITSQKQQVQPTNPISNSDKDTVAAQRRKSSLHLGNHHHLSSSTPPGICIIPASDPETGIINQPAPTGPPPSMPKNPCHLQQEHRLPANGISNKKRHPASTGHTSSPSATRQYPDAASTVRQDCISREKAIAANFHIQRQPAAKQNSSIMVISSSTTSSSSQVPSSS
ncbi:hypothetical protein Nepgr_023105 [Nepenthes gracilis]|uniref:Uncharacterized protein n=1 Tax=Nepenthes gracilis TaxID=150966 RepID=A0AAD3T1G4_NEPGR|nr:hypothetical protein Nepgr_023105 [Nepenthes gracilis]